MLLGKLSGKSFALGFAVGLVFVLLLEWTGVLVLARLHRKSPQELATRLAPPPLPSTLDADYALALQTLEGAPFNFASLKGKTVFLGFWNPDCATCQAELPSIQTLYDKVKGDKVAFVLAAVTGSQQEALNVATEYKLTVPLYRVQGSLGSLYKTSVPSTFVISPEGKIAFKHEGPARWDGEGVVRFILALGAAS